LGVIQYYRQYPPTKNPFRILFQAVKSVIRTIAPRSWLDSYLKWQYRGASGTNPRLKTSCSDNLRYPQFCLKASQNLRLFAKFRKNATYREILENTNARFGALYLDEMRKVRPEFLDRIEDIKANDLYGSPDLAEYPTIGKICPSPLYYAKVTADLLHRFGSLDNFKIAEIGVGYGGQCRMINAFASPLEYTLIDIRPALRLAQTYLDGYALKSRMRYLTINELPSESYDLVISNYAFSELRRDIQEVYMERVVKLSKRGYMIYNYTVVEGFDAYTIPEFLDAVKTGGTAVEEFPAVTAGSNTFIWGA
jgi:putative sugar O-methyltransferase